MAKGANQKLKLLYLTKIFSEHTDEAHGLTLQEIISYLKNYDVNADRKTLYLDFEELRHFGLDIISIQTGHTFTYHLASRDFELAELKLLVDSVQSSRFITEKKSRELIKKLESLVSAHEAKQLHRQVILTGRVKTMNESIYYNVDKIHTAINADCQISFQYFQWNVKKQMEIRHDGERYEISPWALVWADENYYLIGYDPQSKIIKHYRVDKMLHLEISEKKRVGKDTFNAMELPNYAQALFGMYGGKSETVTLRCENNLVGAIIDRFGKDIPIIPDGGTHFQTHIQVSASQQFLGWIIALGVGVQIVAPTSMIEAMKQEIRRLQEQYL